MKRKGKQGDGILDGFAKDLERCPEWAADAPGRGGLILYFFLIIAGLCLCLGTLAVLLG